MTAASSPILPGRRRLQPEARTGSISQISNEQLFDWIIEMAKSRRSLTLKNTDRWGLADEVFLEATSEQQ